MRPATPPAVAAEEGSAPRIPKRHACKDVLTLAYQSLGVIYGDISTSPLYVYKSTFSGKLSLHENDEEVFGVLSFIFWTLTLIPLFKYIFFVLSSDDNGEGGTFALYSLLCRHARLGMLPNQQAADENLSAYDVEGTTDTWESSMLKEFFKKRPIFRNGLLILVLLGTCMAIGDGVLTPTISGTETMFANLGHFSSLSIKIAFTSLVYPCLVLAYMGEAAFLSKHHEDIQQSFYKAIPEPVFWPVFIVATFAAVVGSQAVISATFSMVSQCCALNCFPRVKIVHTSNEILGQIYIPEINWILMCLCLAVTIGLRNTNVIAHAYGLVITIVIFVTTCLMSLVIILVWKQKIIVAVGFLVFFGSIELLYASASIIKIPEGGWIPLALAMIFMMVMYIWNYGTLRKHEFDLENKVSVERVLALGPTLGMVRVPGIGLVFADLVTGVPAVFGQFATNLPAFHQVLVFVCIKSVQVPYVSEEERFLVGRMGPKEFHLFRCIVRYGYKDPREENYDFESILVSKIVAFIEMEEEFRASDTESLELSGRYHEEGSLSSPDMHLVKPEGYGLVEGSIRRDESWEILKAKESGVVYILGNSYAKAKKSSSLIKKIAIDVVFAFLSKNCRGADVFLNVPQSLLLEVGMISSV